eukprot:scaffold3.g6649.t1
MKKKRGGQPAALFGQDAAWRAVDVGDDFLLGAEEFGFMGLEELDPKAAGALLIASGGEATGLAADAADAAEGAPAPPAKKQGKKRKQPEAAGKGSEGDEGGERGVAARAAAAEGDGDAREGGETMEQLRAQLAAAKAENKQLKKKAKREAKAAAKQQRRAEAAAPPPADVEAWRDYGLGPAILGVLARLGFAAPTHVQAECLPAAIRDRRDVIGAAQTGSGKTLAFGLPILELLLRERQQRGAQAAEPRGRRAGGAGAVGAEGGAGAGADGGAEGQQGRLGSGGPLRALVLAPTRELALQVYDHLQAFGRATGVWVVPIVGGISQQKQERLLARRPEVVVATPGRLWDLMSAGHAHLTNLNHLSFLVIDEADRMVQQGHYSELSSILGAIPTRKQLAAAAAEDARLAREDARVRVLPPLPPKAAARAQRAAAAAAAALQRVEAAEEEDAVAEAAEEPATSEDEELQEGEEEGEEEEAASSSGAEEEEEEEAGSQKEEEESSEEQADEEEDDGQQQQPGQQQERHQRGAGGAAAAAARALRLQTFVFSATLTLPAEQRRRLRKGGGGASGSSTLESSMDKVPMGPKPKIVDLTSRRRLADKARCAALCAVLCCAVEEAYVACSEGERDDCLYAILARHPGRAIVFVNAISSVRRLAAILKLLGLPAHALHAEMQQRARLKALDRFRAAADAILVATDVAARGLDIKDVRCVVHYQLPASVDVYVHRSGRTGRAEAEGLSIALVTPKENARFLALLRALGREEPPQFPLDWSLLPRVRERVRLAVRLDELSRRASKARAERSWRQHHAEELGIVLSEEEEGEEEAAVQAKRDATAEELRGQLAALLAEPLQPKLSSKWFTGGRAAAVAVSLQQHEQPAAGPVPGAAGKKQRRQRLKTAARERRGRAAAAAADGDGEPGAGAGAGAAAAVSEAVALARRLADSHRRTAAETAVAAAKQKRKGRAKWEGAAAGRGAAAGNGADPRAAALAAALKKHAVGKQARRRGLVVVPQALGRDAAGPDALAALRRRLAATG